MPMRNPPHPGESVREDCIAACNLTIAEAAAHMGIDERQLTDVCHGRAPITADIAIRVDMAFGGTADVWLALQASYDLAQARKRAADLSIERVPVPEPEPATVD